MENSLIEQSKKYLSELLLRVEKIQDDVLCEELDVFSQLIHVSTALADWKSFPLSDIADCCRLDKDIIWERRPYSDFREGDVIETTNVPICKIDKILRNEREVDISILLHDGNTKHFRCSDFDQVLIPEKQRSLREMTRIKESSDVYTAISWKESYVLSVKVGDIIRSESSFEFGRVQGIHRGFHASVVCPDGQQAEVRFLDEDYRSSSIFKITSTIHGDWRSLAGIHWKQCEPEELQIGDIFRHPKEGICKVKEIATSQQDDFVSCDIAAIRPDQTEKLMAFKGNSIHPEEFEKIVQMRAGKGTKNWNSVGDVTDVATTMLKATDPLLVVSGPGTGKTWFMHQLCNRLVSTLRTQPLRENTALPVIVSVQALARLMRLEQVDEDSNPMETSDMLVRLFAREWPQHTPLLEFKLSTGQLVLLIDGMDEAGEMRKKIETLIHKTLNGNKVVVSSRPEGISLPLYFRDFNIINLLPLTHNQQLDVITRFAKGDEFLASLFKLSNVRQRHDELYESSFDLKQRDFVESLVPFDRFQSQCGEWDPQLRQKSIDGSEIVETAVIRSSYLMNLQEHMKTGSVLSKLETGLEEYVQSNKKVLTTVAAKSVVDGIFHNYVVAEESLSDLKKICVRLCQLRINTASSGNKTTMEELWNQIVSRTDALYISAEMFEQHFENLLSELNEQFPDDDQLRVARGPIKDPVRLYEKAQNDYKDRFQDGALPESCVVDILRARLVCRDAETMEQVVKMLQTADDGAVSQLQSKVETIRLKNMFHPSQITPTHFRFQIMTLKLSNASTHFLVEIQLQHDELMRLEESAGGHAAYEFFRSLLKERYSSVLGQALEAPRMEESLCHFESIAKVPILLSLIVLVLLERQNEDPLGALQSNRLELYQKAFGILIRKSVPCGVDADKKGEEYKLLLEMLTRISTENMRARRRIFGLEDVQRALGDRSDLIRKWNELQQQTDTSNSNSKSSNSIPLIKTLVEPYHSEMDAEYQFKHLSFSEALYFQHLIKDVTIIPLPEALSLLSDPFYQNVLSFGPDDQIASVLLVPFEEYVQFPNGITIQAVKNLERMVLVANSDHHYHVQSVLGVLVGKEQLAEDFGALYYAWGNHENNGDEKVIPKYSWGSSRTVGTTLFHVIRSIGRQKGILAAMMEGDLQRVQEFVAKYGNLPIVSFQDHTSSTGPPCKRVVDGLTIFSSISGTNRTFWYWDGISTPHQATNLLELAIESLQLPVARAIQNGMMLLNNSGGNHLVNPARFFVLLKSGVEQHTKMSAYRNKLVRRMSSLRNVSPTDSISPYFAQQQQQQEE